MMSDQALPVPMGATEAAGRLKHRVVNPVRIDRQDDRSIDHVERNVDPIGSKPALVSRLFTRTRLETGCTIEIAHTNESLHAHVALDQGGDLQPGDQVRVHGSPIQVPFGEEIRLRRRATVTRASKLEQAWVRFLAGFEICELYEVTFSPGSIR